MWQQFHEEYLAHMRMFHIRKGCFSKRPIKVGDVVLVKKDNKVARNFWPIAKVAKVVAGKRRGIHTNCHGSEVSTFCHQCSIN
jgi:hypothetical protein